jgi:hypothetical protein
MENIFDISEMYELSRIQDLKKIIDNLSNPNPTVEGEYQSLQRLITLLYPDPSKIHSAIQPIQTNIQTLVQSYKDEEKEIKDLDTEIKQKKDTIAKLRKLNQPTTAPSP